MGRQCAALEAQAATSCLPSNSFGLTVVIARLRRDRLSGHWVKHQVRTFATGYPSFNSAALWQVMPLFAAVQGDGEWRCRLFEICLVLYSVVGSCGIFHRARVLEGCTSQGLDPRYLSRLVHCTATKPFCVDGTGTKAAEADQQFDWNHDGLSRCRACRCEDRLPGFAVLFQRSLLTIHPYLWYCTLHS